MRSQQNNQTFNDIEMNDAHTKYFTWFFCCYIENIASDRSLNGWRNDLMCTVLSSTREKKKKTYGGGEKNCYQNCKHIQNYLARHYVWEVYKSKTIGNEKPHYSLNCQRVKIDKKTQCFPYKFINSLVFSFNIEQ